MGSILPHGMSKNAHKETLWRNSSGNKIFGEIFDSAVFSSDGLVLESRVAAEDIH